MDGSMLEKLTREVLQVLHNIGYTVMSLIADDNSVNRKMFENLCGGEELKEWIPHPLDPSKRLYLLFDTVHLFKNIRNNWINNAAQTFKLPPVPNFHEFMQEYRDSSKSVDSASVVPTIPEGSIPTINQPCNAELSNSNIPSSDHENSGYDLSGLENLENLWLLENEEEMNSILSEEFENDPFLLESKENVNPNTTISGNNQYIEAKFSDIKFLYFAESRLLLKLSPKLSRKSVFPSKIDRQNVSLVMKVFNDFTILALETLRKDGSMDVSEGSIILLCWIVRWWKVVNVKSPLKGIRINDKWCKPIYGPKDEKLKFLNDFLVFLKSWQHLDVGEGNKGKLTHQTYEALSHTVSALLSLCKYVFDSYGWDYVLLGKLMTDLIEARFGGYRRLSGCNYHVSVEQVLESERKLRILGVLKLKTASGEFCINSFCERVKAASQEENEENLDAFKNSIYDKEYVPLPLNSKRVLIVLASYTATKVIQTFKREEKPFCPGCQEILITDTQLEIERPAELYDYLSGIDRGGLNKPAAFSFDLCANIYKLFETLVSPAYEAKFLKLKFHRKAIVTLGMRMCNAVLENTHSVCDDCETCVEKVMEIFLTTMANILLNNYTKKLNDLNASRQIAAKLSKKKALKEKDTNKIEATPVGKKKDVAARKVLKLSSNESY